MLDSALAPALDSGACPHLAVLLRNDAEFAPVVASFYSLGAKRGGFLAHRGVQVDRDRQALASAGLDVAGLESESQLVIEQLDLDEPPDRLPRRLEAAFDDALGRGFNGLWSSHSPVGPEPGRMSGRCRSSARGRSGSGIARSSPSVPMSSRASKGPPRSGASPTSPVTTMAFSCPPMSGTSFSGRSEPPARPLRPRRPAERCSDDQAIAPSARSRARPSARHRFTFV
jgi:hypothetical protein